MLKNIIFDLDNTIIRDHDEDAERYRVLLRKYGYDEEKWKELYDYIGEYDFVYPEDKYYYNRKEMLEYLNNSMRENYSIEFIDGVLTVEQKTLTITFDGDKVFNGQNQKPSVTNISFLCLSRSARRRGRAATCPQRRSRRFSIPAAHALREGKMR